MNFENESLWFLFLHQLIYYLEADYPKELAKATEVEVERP
jgi:hypothetical protein